MAAISSREEEDLIKEQILAHPTWKVGITYVTGRRSEIEKGFVKSIVACALNGGVIHNRPGAVRGDSRRAGMPAGVSATVVAESNLKLKVALVSDGHWVAVAAHGESAFHPDEPRTHRLRGDAYLDFHGCMAIAARPAAAPQSPVAVDENASRKPRAPPRAPLFQIWPPFCQVIDFAMNSCKTAAL
ncbi:HutP family protein [Rhodobacter capsulatus]|uniref:HutP family protein n=1 Tax=Rhodobacter capsulatus TaxID=1061 RepID=UPI004029D31F